MEGKRFRVGSVAVLFAVVVLCVAIFCILTAVTAMADMRTARQYGDHIERVYHCQELGEQWLARVDAYYAGQAPLSEDAQQDGERLCAEITDGPICLKVAVERDGNTYRILQWECTTLWQPEQGWTLLQ